MIPFLVIFSVCCGPRINHCSYGGEQRAVWGNILVT